MPERCDRRRPERAHQRRHRLAGAVGAEQAVEHRPSVDWREPQRGVPRAAAAIGVGRCRRIGRDRRAARRRARCGVDGDVGAVRYVPRRSAGQGRPEAAARPSPASPARSAGAGHLIAADQRAIDLADAAGAPSPVVEDRAIGAGRTGKAQRPPMRPAAIVPIRSAGPRRSAPGNARCKARLRSERGRAGRRARGIGAGEGAGHHRVGGGSERMFMMAPRIRGSVTTYLPDGRRAIASA